MGDFFIATETAPSTPSAGNAVIWVDSTSKVLFWTDDTGRHNGQSKNAAVGGQGPGFATDNYITGSDLLIPSFGFQTKAVFQWMISASRTAFGVATPIYNIRIGTGKSTSDTIRLALTGPAQTAIADIGTLVIVATVRSIGGAGVIQGTAWWDHRGTAASSTIGVGFANDGTGHVEATSAGFDMTTGIAGSSIGLSINGGTSAVWSLTQVISMASW